MGVQPVARRVKAHLGDVLEKSYAVTGVGGEVAVDVSEEGGTAQRGGLEEIGADVGSRVSWLAPDGWMTAMRASRVSSSPSQSRSPFS